MLLLLSLVILVTTSVQVQAHCMHMRRANLADEIARGISLITISLYGDDRQERLTSTGPDLAGASKLRGRQ
jgi:hypothetical protein